MSYFESIAYYRGDTRPSAEQRFKDSVKKVLGADASKGIRERLWRDVRNGLYHSGITHPRVFVTTSRNVRDQPIVRLDRQSFLWINVDKLIDRLEEDFDALIFELKSQQNVVARAHFERHWDVMWDPEKYKVFQSRFRKTAFHRLRRRIGDVARGMWSCRS